MTMTDIAYGIPPFYLDAADFGLRSYQFPQVFCRRADSFSD